MADQFQSGCIVDLLDCNGRSVWPCVVSVVHGNSITVWCDGVARRVHRTRVRNLLAQGQSPKQKVGCFKEHWVNRRNEVVYHIWVANDQYICFGLRDESLLKETLDDWQANRSTRRIQCYPLKGPEHHYKLIKKWSRKGYVKGECCA